MALRKIAYLTPLYLDETAYLGGGDRFALNLAKGVVHASGGSCTVELISYGRIPRVRTLAPGVIQVDSIERQGYKLPPKDLCSPVGFARGKGIHAGDGPRRPI